LAVYKRTYIIHRHFVLARSWSCDKTDEARLLVEHSNMLSLSWNVNLGIALYKWCTVASETFKYVVPRLAYHHEDAARVMTFQPRDNIF